MQAAQEFLSTRPDLAGDPVVQQVMATGTMEGQPVGDIRAWLEMREEALRDTPPKAFTGGEDVVHSDTWPRNEQ